VNELCMDVWSKGPSVRRRKLPPHLTRNKLNVPRRLQFCSTQSWNLSCSEMH